MKILTLLKLLFLFITLPAIANAQWMNTNSPHFSEVTASGKNLFAAEQFNGIYISTNNGNNWSLTSLAQSGFNKVTSSGANIYSGTLYGDNRGIYISSNNGLNWTHTLSPSELYGITAISASANNVFTSTGRFIYHSTNSGANWTQTPVTFFVYALAINGSNIFAGVETEGVYLSTNNGVNWAQTSLNNRNVISLAFSNNNLFAGTDEGVYFSTNNGTTWTQTSLNNRYVSSLVISNGNIFAGTDAGVYLSKDNGLTWIQKNQGLGTDVSDGPHLACSNDFIFASNPSSRTYRRNLSEIISVRQISSSLPDKFSLEQNYPNPFNPVTKIIFSLPKSTFASLKIFNQLGKEITNLVKQKLNAGSYELIFDATSLSSGVYYYRLETENSSLTKSMVLIK
ncbi:MAG: T9SS type A sorting domain-containing protein [Bacteroidetes bacterium]|nr:T9SS type A sorting domain-containing protein [Bacteroidota bacterium]